MDELPGEGTHYPCQLPPITGEDVCVQDFREGGGGGIHPFQPFKIEFCSLYAHSLPTCFSPHLGIFLNEPLVYACSSLNPRCSHPPSEGMSESCHRRCVLHVHCVENMSLIACRIAALYLHPHFLTLERLTLVAGTKSCFT